MVLASKVMTGMKVTFELTWRSEYWKWKNWLQNSAQARRCNSRMLEVEKQRKKKQNRQQQFFLFTSRLVCTAAKSCILRTSRLVRGLVWLLTELRICRISRLVGLGRVFWARFWGVGNPNLGDLYILYVVYAARWGWTAAMVRGERREFWWEKSPYCKGLWNPNL